jgi:hypothetical protein
MALSTAERQKHFRAERDGFYRWMTHGPKSAARAIIRVLGYNRACVLSDHLVALLDKEAVDRDPDGYLYEPWLTPIAHDAKGPAGRDMCLVKQAMMMEPINAEHRRLVAAISPANKRRLRRFGLKE